MPGRDHLSTGEGKGLEKAYRLSAEGIWTPIFGLMHRDEEYDPAGFDVLVKMQADHFWYRGRHRLIDREFQRAIGDRAGRGWPAPEVVDLGGGCGGWMKYLMDRHGSAIAEAALADSSLRALELARSSIGDGISYYQADLMSLGWTGRWDIAFLLDVIEHLPDDVGALRQVQGALRPGGLLFLTVPALPFFWSYNDVIAKHLRRYVKKDLERLASESGLRLIRWRYFMFVLSPLILLRRLFPLDVTAIPARRVREHVSGTHATPLSPINGLLAFLLTMEETLGRVILYPWGASLLGVFGKE